MRDRLQRFLFTPLPPPVKILSFPIQGMSSPIDKYRMLLEVSESIASHREMSALFHDLGIRLHRVLEFDFLVLILHDPQEDVARLHVLETSRPTLVQPGLALPVHESPSMQVIENQRICVVSDIDRETTFPLANDLIRSHGVLSYCMLPVTTVRKRLGIMGIGSVRKHAYDSIDGDFLKRVTNQVALAVDNALAYEQISQLKDRLAEEKLYLEDEIRSDYNFEEIVGDSQALRKVLRAAETVAATDSTVLIQGETGTGKELIARAIHNLSLRKQRTFVKINCAAIPTGLLESELFGHERGAFTGAIAQKSGRFELAHRGTLFLDEVGDIPLELQPKLLRVLQEHEFERLGSTRTLQVDVRLVAATNRDLLQMVDQGTFRRDLFYRLHVFPLQIPPLRERREDIPDLVRYFTQKYSRRMSKRIESISQAFLQEATLWDWPGNVRELENYIERAVILTHGAALQMPSSDMRPPSPLHSPHNHGCSLPADSLETMERRHIRKVLEETGWVISGPRGAAERLGMKRTTLQARMKKLGLTRRAL